MTVRQQLHLQRRRQRKTANKINIAFTQNLRRLGRWATENQSFDFPNYLLIENRERLKSTFLKERLAIARIMRDAMIKKGSKIKKQDDEIRQNINGKINEYNLEKASSVSKKVHATYMKKIYTYIAFVKERPNFVFTDVPKLFKSLAGTGLKGRANLVARNETHDAMTHANYTSAQELDAGLSLDLKKVWISTEDQRTRQDHYEAGGQTVPINEAFDIGGFPMDRPHDPFAPAEQVVNCRCVLSYI